MRATTDKWARRYIARGFSPIPVPFGEKGPKKQDWQHLRMKAEEVGEYFKGKSNIGLILGIDGLADVDLDCAEALRIADHFLPGTDMVFGRKSRPRSHRLYSLDKPIPSRKFLDPLKDKGGSTLLELRCTKGDGEIGLQTIVPPSVHPSGERIRFDGDGDPARVKSEALILSANYTAAAALLVRYWPDERCGRNEAFLALHGMLARGGFPLEDAIQLAEGIYLGLFGAEADMNQAAREANATFKKMTDGMAITGFKHLTEFIDERVVRRALLWLNVKDGAAPPAYSPTERKSQATQLVAAAAAAELFHTADDEAYASIELGSHREVHRLKDREFKRWLGKTFYDQHGRVPTSQAMNDVLGILEGKALYGSPRQEVFVRIARREKAIYLDLGDPCWRAVKITGSEWKVVERPKVKFRRPRGMRALPEPVEGGSLEELRQFVNVRRENDWEVLVACLVGAFQPEGPFPLLVLQGEQGSAKSTSARILRSLVDPNKSPLRSPPREIRDIMIAAQNGWIVAFDNISYLPPWLSDALCSLATGGGFSTRELYTDASETIFAATRPILLNGIAGVVVRGDLLDRSYILELPEISEARRKPEKELWADFHEAQPRILGALLEAVVGALCNQHSVDIPALPRMADFAVWATAAEEAIGWRPGTAFKALMDNQSETKTLPLDASPIVPALCTMLRVNDRYFKGTATAVLQELEDRTQSEKRRPRDWPKSAHALSKELRRLAAHLRAAGVHVIFRKTNGSHAQRLIKIKDVRGFCDACDASDAKAKNE
jgi:hypothetical protein